MTAIDYDALRARLIEACDAARGRGMEIVANQDGDGVAWCCCPVIALVVFHDGVVGATPFERAGQLLGVPLSAVMDITEGVDVIDGVDSAAYPAAYTLGRELRRRYIDAAPTAGR